LNDASHAILFYQIKKLPRSEPEGVEGIDLNGWNGATRR
jgi:hypothetical protein